MQAKDIIAIIIISIISAIIVTISIIMLTGHGTKLLAGYNSLPQDEKDKFDAKKLTKFLGCLFLPIGILFNCITIGILLHIWWLSILVGIIIFLVIIFAVIYCNMSNRFKK